MSKNIEKSRKKEISVEISYRSPPITDISAEILEILFPEYINMGELPDDRNKAHKVQIQSARFSLVNGQLFKRSLDGPYLKCLTTEHGRYVLVELHEGICGNHLGDRTLAQRAHTQGYYW